MERRDVCPTREPSKVDGPLECSVTLGVVARAARKDLPWRGAREGHAGLGTSSIGGLRRADAGEVGEQTGRDKGHTTQLRERFSYVCWP